MVGAGALIGHFIASPYRLDDMMDAKLLAVARMGHYVKPLWPGAQYIIPIRVGIPVGVVGYLLTLRRAFVAFPTPSFLFIISSMFNCTIRCYCDQATIF